MVVRTPFNSLGEYIGHEYALVARSKRTSLIKIE
jgi:hypothetical protein